MVMSAASKKEGISFYFQCISFTCFTIVGIKYCHQFNRFAYKISSFLYLDCLLRKLEDSVYVHLVRKIGPLIICCRSVSIEKYGLKKALGGWGL
jgi:hypothetical protein